MFADIVPLLAAITGLDQDVANSAFAAAWDEARVDTEDVHSGTFVEAVMIFRAAYPFALADLYAARKAKDDLDARPTGAP